jgi:transposase
MDTKKVWAAKGIRPVRIVSGYHRKTVVFGAISLDGRQFFRQYDVFNGETFLDYIKKIHRHYGKLYLFMDRAKQHYDTDIVTEYLRANRKTLRVRWIPTASPEFNMLEECWREGEKDLCRLPVFPTVKEELKSILAKYYRTRRFSTRLDMKRFLLTNRGFTNL